MSYLAHYRVPGIVQIPSHFFTPFSVLSLLFGVTNMTTTPRLLITGSRTHQWTPYDSHALLIAVQEIVENPTHGTHRVLDPYIPSYTNKEDSYHHG